MVDDNNTIISFSKHLCFHPKESKDALTMCVPTTSTPRLWDTYLEGWVGERCKYEDRTAMCCTNEVKEGYFVVVESNSQIQIWSGKQDKYPIVAQGSSVAAVIKDIGVLIYFEALLEAQLPLILLWHWFSTNVGGRDLPRNNKNYFLRLCRFCCSLFHRPARPASN